MNVKIEVVDHKSHRYPTCGDWLYDESGDLVIRVSAMGDWRYEMLVAFHELREVLQCKHEEVTQESVDWFDKGYEAAREVIAPKDTSEPGDSPKAPYTRAHKAATKAERDLAKDLGVNWDQYADEIDSLF